MQIISCRNDLQQQQQQQHTPCIWYKTAVWYLTFILV